VLGKDRSKRILWRAGATTACGSGIDPRLSLPAIKNLFRQAGISEDCAAEKRSGTKNVSFAPFLSRKEKEVIKISQEITPNPSTLLRAADR
jgi:hypothetical protein